MPTLYLIEVRARDSYRCSACRTTILKGSHYFRHDPFPSARMYRGHKTSHWCLDCIRAADPGEMDRITGRYRVPSVRIGSTVAQEPIDGGLFAPVVVKVVTPGASLTARLLQDPEEMHGLSPAQFEEFICDRLYAMGMEPRQVGSTTRKDGGVDIVFWPRLDPVFPFLGAAQVKHHRDSRAKEGSPSVRDFAGTIASQPFDIGILVTNTAFTADAEWFARERARLLRLRDFQDLRRWLTGSFGDDAEWREVPSEIELCPGVTIKVR